MTKRLRGVLACLIAVMLAQSAYSQKDVPQNVVPKPVVGARGPNDPTLLAQDVAVDAAGNVFVADPGPGRIRKVASDGVVSVVAGAGKAGFSGDSGPATAAQISVGRIQIDGKGNLYLSEGGRIRRVDTAGIITTIVGTGVRGTSGDGGPATSAQLFNPGRMALDNAGNLFVVEQNAIRKISANGTISTVAGKGATAGFDGDGGPATAALLNRPYDVAVDSMGNLFIADGGNNRIRKVTPEGMISTVASGLTSVSAVAVDKKGDLLAAAGGRLLRISKDGVPTVVAGTGLAGYLGDGGPATAAQVQRISAIAIGAAGDIFIADGTNCRIRRIAPDGTISTFIL